MKVLFVFILVLYLTTSPLLASIIIQNHISVCSTSEFSCGDGACVSQDLVCDGRPDCADAADELDCHYITNTTSDWPHRWKRQSSVCRDKWQWRCRDGSCIRFDRKCDGMVDCPDKSDESHAVCRKTPCQPNWFRCTYGACVDGTAACNGVQECADNSDELLPQCRKESDEVRGKFKCQDGSQISVGDKCDGIPNCPDGSDETVRACGSIKCSNYLFQCAYGACVDQGSDCNGQQDCADGSDEAPELCNTASPVGPVATTTTTARPQAQTGDCELPPYPQHGSYIGNFDNAKPGQRFDFITLNYSCISGFKLVGAAAMFCYQGHWQYPDQPMCIRLCELKDNPTLTYQCKIPNTNGGFRSCGSAEPDGTVVEPKCRTPNYYSPTGLPIMRCIDGNWDYNAHCVPECGKVTPTSVSLVADGVSAKHGELPWHVGVYEKTTRPYMQICGGSIVTTQLVISAAHCFWTDGTGQKDANLYAVAGGKIYRNWNLEDEFAQRRDVTEIKIPPTYYGAETNFDYDIALVFTSRPFEYKNYLRPVCLSFDLVLESLQLKDGVFGRVAGWGFTSRNGNASQVLKVVELPYINQGACLARAPTGYRDLVTSQKFCAGNEDGKTVCRGDSGGGLVFSSTELGVTRFYLRGVVSTAPKSFDKCNVDVITTFSHVSKSEAFIKPYLSPY